MEHHAGHSVETFRRKFWLSLGLTFLIIVFSKSAWELAGLAPPGFASFAWLSLALSTVLFFYGGWVFVKGSLAEIKGRRPGMMTLISLAILTAYIYSAATVFGLPGEDFFWELASLISIMLLGHWLEMKSIARAEGALQAISQLLPDKAERLMFGRPEVVLVSELKVGDLLLVRPGGSIPADGIVVEGISSVNEAAITGESRPVTKGPSDEVIAGTLNQDGSLTIKVAKLGEDTVLAGIMQLVKEAQTSKSSAQVLADKAAGWLTIIAVAAGGATFAWWLVAQGSLFAVERAVTVLVIACPHALGLAVPLVVTISTTMSARNGLLVRRRIALESARQLDIVLFDKTGTLTRGEHGVTNLWAAAGFSEDQVLGYMASLEQASEHIIGRAILKKAAEWGVKLSQVSDFKALPGVGVSAQIDGKDYVVAGLKYLYDEGLKLPPEIEEAAKAAASEGKTVAGLAVGKKVIGAVAMADVIREESLLAIRQINNLGIKTALITGDSMAVAEYVADQLEMTQYFAEVRPGDKAAQVKQLQSQGLKVAMVGDGINDAPALTQADIGIAIGAGTDVAIKSADIILVKSNPLDVVKVIRLSRAAYRKMLQNLFWATGYNVVAIPLAAGVLFGSGILLSPALGAALMSASTVIVALNTQLLRRVQLND